MAFLGSFYRNESVVYSVIWTPTEGDAISGSELTLTHPEGDEVGPIAGTLDGTNRYEASATLTKAGRWTATWVTSPIGGVTHDTVYVE